MKKKNKVFSLVSRVRLTILDIIVILFWLILGIACVIFGTRDAGHAIESINWPYTQGVIIESHVWEHEDDDSSAKSYDPMIKYSYTVNGKTYTNDLVNYDYVNRGKEWAENVIADYPEGQQVTVSYKPDKPEFSVLERGVTGSTYLPIYFGYASIVFSIIYLLARSIWSVWKE